MAAKSNPLLVFLHGKDSSQETWHGALNSPEAKALLGDAVLDDSVCVDLFGHGDNVPAFLAEAKKVIGSQDECDQEDIRRMAQILQGMEKHVGAIEKVLEPLGVLETTCEPQRQIVLVGHSMGARVAAGFAIKHSKSVRHLVLVDMDSRARGKPEIVSSLKELASIPATFSNFDDLCDAMEPHGYTRARCTHFLETGRVVHEDSGSFRTKVHPLVAALSHTALLEHDRDEDFDEVGAKLYSRVWLFCAGRNSAVTDTGLAKCLQLIPRANVIHFPDADHSIHNHTRSRGLFFGSLAALVLDASGEFEAARKREPDIKREEATPLEDKDDYTEVKVLVPPPSWTAAIVPGPEIEKVFLLGEGDERAFLLKNVLSKEECEYFIETALHDLSITALERGTDYRNCDRTLCESRQVADVIFARIAPFIQNISVTQEDHQNIGTGRGLLGDWKLAQLNERFRICRYHARKEGHFGPHFDGWVNFPSGERSLKTFMIYLNGPPDFSSGTTNFLESQELFRNDKGRIEARPGTTLFAVIPEPGMALVFNHQFLHEGSAVLPHADGATQLSHPNEKWIMRSDVMFENTSSTLTDGQKRALILLQEAEEAESRKDSIEAQRLYKAAFKLDPELEDELFSSS